MEHGEWEMRMAGGNPFIEQFLELAGKCRFGLLGVGGARIKGELEPVEQGGQFG